MPMLIAALALMVTAMSVQAQEGRWMASTLSAHSKDLRHVPPCPCHGEGLHSDGFTGAFSARETLRNLGY